MTRAAAIPTRADARTTTTAVRIVPLHGLAPEQRALLRAGQREAGVVYTVCMQAHKIARHTRGSWPSYVDLYRLTKGRHPDLCAQSVQATCKAFDGTIKSAVANRKAGNTRMRYRGRNDTSSRSAGPPRPSNGSATARGSRSAASARIAATLIFPSISHVTRAHVRLSGTTASMNCTSA